MEISRRRFLASTGSVSGVAIAGCLEDSGDESATGWLSTPIEDVRTGESFSIAEFDRPVLVQTFAVWCTTCRAQSGEIKQLRKNGHAVEAVSLNVDPNEDATQVRTHADANGYDWRWGVASSDLTNQLIDAFGASVAQAPRAPVILVCPDGETRRLDDGVKSTATLAEELESGC